MIRNIKATAVSIWKDERGASLLEYSILIGLITAGVVVTITQVGTWVGTKWTALKAALGA
jgi:pilus assembly protein Flp/PilA